MAQISETMHKHISFKYFIILQEYQQHEEESDPERIQQIIQQTIKDANWIVNKVSIYFGFLDEAIWYQTILSTVPIFHENLL